MNPRGCPPSAGRGPAAALGFLLAAAGAAFLAALSGQSLFPGLLARGPVLWRAALGGVLPLAVGLFLMLRRPALPPFPAQKLAVALGLALLLGALLETAARIWLGRLATYEQKVQYVLAEELPPRALQWSPHHYLNYYPTPLFRRGGTRHNRLGFRGSAIRRDKPDGAFRIAVLGGSSVYTIGVEDDRLTFPAQLETILREEYGRTQVEVINAGAGGYNSWESLVNLCVRVLDLEPDLVIVYHGINDVHARLVAPAAYAADNSGRRRQWRAPAVPFFERSVLLRILSRKLGLTHAVGLETMVEAPTYFGAGSPRYAGTTVELHARLLAQNRPLFFARNLTNMVAVSRAHGAAIVLSTWAYSPHFNDYLVNLAYRRGVEENNDVVRRTAAALGVPLFDCAALMPPEPDLWLDSRHVNERGARVMAGLFARFLHEHGLAAAPPD